VAKKCKQHNVDTDRCKRVSH